MDVVMGNTTAVDDINNMEMILSRLENMTLEKSDFLPTKQMYQVYMNVSKNPSGRGYLSSIFDVVENEIARHVVKISRPCLQSVQVNIDLCKILVEQGAIFKLPYDNNTLYMMPNTLSEGVISGILNEFPFRKQCPLFGNTVGIFYSETDRTTYAFMDKYHAKIMEVIENGISTQEIAYYILFQIAYALAKAQELHEFTHYDLHTGNIVFEKINNPVEYNIRTSATGGINVELLNPFSFNVRIIDFGFARIKRKNVIIHPRVGVKSLVDIYAVFNPCYDLTSFIGIILQLVESPRAYSGETVEIANGFKNTLGREGLIDILRFMYNITDPSFDYKSLYYKDIWRPLHVTKYHNNAKTMYEMALYFLGKMSALGPTIKSYYRDDNKLYRQKDYAIGVPETSIVLNSVTDSGIGFILHYPDIRNVIRSWARTTTKPYYHHTFGNIDGHTPKQIITVMYVDSEKAMQEGYMFTTVCCKMDPKEFMKSHTGVAINGGFFDINNSFRPIGPYRQTNNLQVYESYIEIPPLYVKDYGVVIFDGKKSGITIMQYDEYVQIEHKEDNVFVSGPMLVRNGNIVFTDANIKSSTIYHEKQIYPYQCREPRNPTESSFKFLESNIREINGYIPNCSKVVPGELSHASNPNPRSMLIKREKDNFGDYAFVVVEGRGNRGDGMDLDLMARLAKSLKAIDAINLDGGRSSTLAWNFGTKVYTNNDQRIDKYVAGNIIAMVKPM